MDDVVTMKYVVKKLKRNRVTIYRWCDRGLLPFTKAENRYHVFNRAHIDALAASLRRKRA